MVGFMPGFAELLILALFALFVVVVVIVISSRRKGPMPNPQLKPCPDCQNMVSIHATTCPRCGRPLEPSKTG